jgi:hypothetical protein
VETSGRAPDAVVDEIVQLTGIGLP